MRASSRCQASSWSGMLLGKTWASVSQTSIEANAFMRCENPPSIDTSNSQGKDLTKTGQEP